jgi:hypothetical protein
VLTSSCVTAALVSLGREDHAHQAGVDHGNHLPERQRHAQVLTELLLHVLVGDENELVHQHARPREVVRLRPIALVRRDEQAHAALVGHVRDERSS